MTFPTDGNPHRNNSDRKRFNKLRACRNESMTLDELN